MALTGQGFVLGAGTLLVKLDDKALPIGADQERIWTLLSVAYGHEVPLAVLGSLRRAAKHWQGGDKCLAAIHLAQMGLPDIGEDAAYRLSLAAELIMRTSRQNGLRKNLGSVSPPVSSNTIRTSRACQPEAGGKAASGRRLGMPRLKMRRNRR
jgi:hypothetical protein